MSFYNSFLYFAIGRKALYHYRQHARKAGVTKADYRYDPLEEHQPDLVFLVSANAVGVEDKIRDGILHKTYERGIMKQHEFTTQVPSRKPSRPLANRCSLSSEEEFSDDDTSTCSES